MRHNSVVLPAFARAIHRRFAVLAIVGATGLALLSPSRAQAQCPLGSLCFFGLDANGTATTRATNVNAAAAQTSFLNNLFGVGTETFETASGSAPLALAFPGAGTATLTGAGNVVTQGAGTNGAGRYPISGTRFFEAQSATGGGTTFTINFSSPVAAFGFFGVDIGDFGSQLSLVFTLMGGGTLTWALPYTAGPTMEGSILYAGFINQANPFTSVAFRGTNSDDIFAFDNMTVGSVTQVQLTPEPGSLLLMSSALAFVGLIVGRRRSA